MLTFQPNSSDDGWLGRSATLSTKMNDEIVKRLRDNGWQCHSFGQPVKSGGYITVRASKLGKEIGIALLYSCATDNKVYKELEVTMIIFSIKEHLINKNHLHMESTSMWVH